MSAISEISTDFFIYSALETVWRRLHEIIPGRGIIMRIIRVVFTVDNV